MMGLVGVSLWIALVTVVPGLVTIAAVFGAAVVVDPGYVAATDTGNEWLWGAVAVAVMVVTQALGILLEGALVDGRRLGPETIPVPDRIAAGGDVIDPYGEYEDVYFLLVRLGPDDDAHGHLERALAQFFLTNNTLVSFGIGVVATVALAVRAAVAGGLSTGAVVGGALYVGLLVVLLWVSYRVAVARFRVMVQSVWMLRQSS